MNRFTRIWRVLTGVFTIIISILMFENPDMGYILATIILGSVLFFRGLKQLIYFFSMGIHMVGGKMILYRALITMDVGFFTITIHGIGQRYIMFYFTMYYIYAGIVSIFKAFESRRFEAGTWKMSFISGIYDVSIAMICLFNNNSEKIKLDILCLTLIKSAFTRIIIA